MSIPNARYDPDFPPKTNLIVNYIPPALGEQELVEIFQSAGPIESVRIMKNLDGTGKGYGFVKYRLSSDAEKAIGRFDGLPLMGKSLKVAFSRPGASRDNANLFITHIPAEWTSTYIGQHFSMFGEVVEARVLKRDRMSRLCGFVRFNQSEDALYALQHRHGWTPPGAHRPMKVTIVQKERRFWRNKNASMDRYRSRSDMYARSPEQYFHPKVRSMPRPYSADREYNDRYQSPNSIYCSPDFGKRQMNIPSPDEIKKSMPESVLTQKLNLTEEMSSLTKQSSSTYIFNLPQMFMEDDVKNMCAKYGEVKNVELQKDKNGKFMGMAMVEYHNPDDATQAREGLEGCKILEKTVQVQMM